MDSTTEDIVYELEVTFFFFQEFFISRSDFELNIGEFTTTTSLFFVHFSVLYHHSEGFFISNLRSTLVNFYFEFTTQTVDDNFEVKLTHTSQDSLSGIFVRIYTKCWVFFYQFSDSHTHFIYVCLSFRFYCDCDYRFWDKHVFQDDGIFFIAKSITCFDIFKSNSCTNITSFDKVDWILFVSMHLHDTADTFVFTRAYVQYIRTRIQVTRIYTEECQATYERIGHDFKCQCSKWFFRIWFTRKFFSCIGVCTFDSFNIYRAG